MTLTQSVRKPCHLCSDLMSATMRLTHSISATLAFLLPQLGSPHPLYTKGFVLLVPSAWDSLLSDLQDLLTYLQVSTHREASPD